VDASIFLAYLLDELSAVAGGTVFPFDISFDDVLALNSAELFHILLDIRPYLKSVLYNWFQRRC